MLLRRLFFWSLIFNGILGSPVRLTSPWLRCIGCPIAGGWGRCRNPEGFLTFIFEMTVLVTVVTSDFRFMKRSGAESGYSCNQFLHLGVQS